MNGKNVCKDSAATAILKKRLLARPTFKQRAMKLFPVTVVAACCVACTHPNLQPAAAPDSPATALTSCTSALCTPAAPASARQLTSPADFPFFKQVLDVRLMLW